VSELERDLGTTTADLATAGRQFSQVSNQLQEVSKEAHGCARATPSSRRTSRLSCVVAFLLCLPRYPFLVVF
jgi:hypothetical protein